MHRWFESSANKCWVIEGVAVRLTADQIEGFQRDGYVVLPDLFSPEEIAALRRPLPRLFAEDIPANVIEKRSGVVRTAMGLHLRHPIYADLVRHPRLIEPASQLLEDDALYAQQVKVNVKAAFEGETWQWHYDFATHHHEDGVVAPLALNLHVFLDDVTEFNGPLHFIAGSHKKPPQPAFLDTTTTSYDLWCVGHDVVAELTAAGRLFAAKGRAGTGLIFGDCLVHCSPPNLSPWDRHIFSLIVNPVSNAYTRAERPDWKHHRDLTPIETVADDCLIAKN
ncbi:MAG: proline hydroxylase [Alphaproteobacteria bacterium]|nr:proline hydroxylase [Alphaproteobacteria bacterium]